MSSIEGQEAAQEFREAGDGLSNGAAARDIKQDAKQTARRTVKALTSRAGELQASTRKYAGAARDQLQTARRRAEDTVRERPAASTLTVFAVGLAVGYGLAACMSNARSGDVASKTVRRLRNR